MSAPPASGRGRGRGASNDGSRGRGRGGSSSRGGGQGSRGRGGRRGNFGGSLTKSDAQSQPSASESSAAPAGPARESSARGKAKAEDQDEVDHATPANPPSAASTALPAPQDDDEDEGLCGICAEPTRMYSIGPCNHPTCHICAVRLRALYKTKECSSCRSTMDRLIFTSSPTKHFAEFTGQDLPYSDAKLAISFETREAMEDTLILLRYNCPDERCEVTSAGWADLKMHAKRDHDRLICDLCIKNKKIFSHEHEMHTQQSLASHMKADHRFCEYCHTHFYSDDELYTHMRDKHEQCHICKASGSETERWQYFRDYNMLEQHFRQRHFLCMSKDCLEKKFVVFDSQMDFKAHQVAEHGAELTNRELKEAMRIEANFHYEDPNAAGSSSGSASRARRDKRGGRGPSEPDPPTRSDPLGLSSLALRANVPGAGPANHSRRIHFGGHTTTTGESSQQQAANALAASNSRSAAGGSSSDKSAAEQHEAYLGRVQGILGGSESKLASFRSAVRIFRAGEMSANDLVDNTYSLVDDLDNTAVVINGLVDLLDTDADKKNAVLQAWNKLRIERTQFPSLVPVAAGSGSYASVGSGFPSASIRNIKSRAASNNQIWENVERAAARGSGQIPGRPGTSREHFPTLGAAAGSKHFTASSSSSAKSAVPGSASHAAKVNASLRAVHGSTPWSQASSTTRVAPPTMPSPPVPYSSSSYPSANKASNGSASKAPKGSSGHAFPALPLNATASAIAAQKRALFNRGAGPGSGGTSGSSTPWLVAGNGGSSRGGGGGRIDSPGSPEEKANPLDVSAVGRRLNDVGLAGGSGSGASTPGGEGGSKGKKKKGVAVMSLGGVHRGA